ncbi:hypothetical protein [Motiliproteus sp. MSK22-1]|uniref:hypothetical protein n=1 Tax=Motiliproteus sp. MSK22-1 TaxID=1897630 RepID=UPI000978467A|nr:hypothetical protein [Motiliproteus sp. MSK22-1]OMH28064.1 hypothetical protein BGP75_22110 [Motiliproteus sp. MSK22-1]
MLGINITELIVLGTFIFSLGMIFGRLVRGLNPWKMLLAVLIFGPFYLYVDELDNVIYTALYGVGFLAGLGNVFGWIMIPFTEIKMGWQLSRAKARANTRRRDEFSQAEENLYRQKEDIEQELHRQKANHDEEVFRRAKQAGDKLAREKLEAEEYLRKQADDLNQREEAFRKQQEQFNNQSYGNNVDDFSWFSDRSVSNHKKFERACEILGMGPGKDIKEYKKKRKILVSQYHSDKVEGCSEAIKKYAKEQTQLLNVAMDVIENHLKI